MKDGGTFLAYLQKFITVSDDDFNSRIQPILKERFFDKKQVITEAGSVEQYFNFILKGLVRKYYLKNQHEICTQISMEGQMILSQESFHSRQPSEYIVEAIEPTWVVSIQHDDLEKLFSSSHTMEHLGRLIVTYSMVIKDRWQMQLVKMTPRERFLNFVTKNPELVQRTPQKFLASFLNIKPETFSRFKHLIRNHGRSPKT
jgi:CRP-like cAMP-binding protein